MMPLGQGFHFTRMTVTQEELGVSIHQLRQVCQRRHKLFALVGGTDSPEMSGRQADLVGHKVRLDRVIQRVKKSQ
jgi:hypothetical protein